LKITGVLSLFLLIPLVCKADVGNQNKLPKQVVMAVDDYLPYVSNNKVDNLPKGYMVDVTKFILTQHNIELILLDIPYSRSLLQSTSKQVDGLFAQRLDSSLFFAPYNAHGKSHVCLYGKTGNTEALVAVKNQRIGLAHGYNIEAFEELSDIQQMVNNNNPLLVRLTGEQPVERYIKMLRSNRISGFVENDYVTNWYLKVDAGAQVKAHRCSEAKEIYVLFFNNYPYAKQMSLLIGQGIEKMRYSGELGRILSLYGLEDWQTKLTTD
jgi:ABC-type amino acid transport substrate-binding protein